MSFIPQMIEKVSINALSFSFVCSQITCFLSSTCLLLFSYGLLVLYIFLYNLRCKKKWLLSYNIVTTFSISPWGKHSWCREMGMWQCGDSIQIAQADPEWFSFTNIHTIRRRKLPGACVVISHDFFSYLYVFELWIIQSYSNRAENNDILQFNSVFLNIAPNHNNLAFRCFIL